MSKMLIAVVTLLSIAVQTGAGMADEVRFYEDGGVTYRETRRVVRRPQSTTRIQERQQTVYRERYTTEMRDTNRTVYSPVTEYRWQAYWHGRWNPFSEPYVAYRWVPRTYWETRTESVRVPVSHRELVPETRIVRVPVTETRMVDEEHITRVAVSPRHTTGTGGGPFVVRREQIGGIAELKNDPPRHGPGVSAAGSTITR